MSTRSDYGGEDIAAAIKNGPQKGEAILSVRQPYALMIVDGWKPVENRSWKTNHRGLLWIHASRGKPSPDWRTEAVETGGIPEREVDAMEPFAFGAIIGAAWLDGCYPYELLPRHLSGNVHAVGEYCWHFTAADSLETPVPYLGAVGLLRFDKRNLKIE